MRRLFPSLFATSFASICLASACSGGVVTKGSGTSPSTTTGSTGSTGGAGGQAGTGGSGDGSCRSDDDCEDFCAYPANDRCLAVPEDCQVGGDDSPCTTDADCGDSLSRCTVCPTVSWCTQRCNAGVPCGPGEQCDPDGRCSLRTCKVDGDCPAQFQCADTGNAALGVRCMRRSCTGDTQCPGGHCVSGLCFTQLGVCSTCN